MMTNPPILDVRRIKELLVESQELLQMARKVQSYAVGYEDMDGQAKRELAGLWCQAYLSRIFSLQSLLRKRELREAV